MLVNYKHISGNTWRVKAEGLSANFFHGLSEERLLDYIRYNWPGCQIRRVYK